MFNIKQLSRLFGGGTDPDCTLIEPIGSDPRETVNEKLSFTDANQSYFDVENYFSEHGEFSELRDFEIRSKDNPRFDPDQQKRSSERAAIGPMESSFAETNELASVSEPMGKRVIESVDYLITNLSSGFIASIQNPGVRLKRIKLCDLDRLDLIWVPFGLKSLTKDIFFQLDGTDGSILNGQIIDVLVVNPDQPNLLAAHHKSRRQICENGTLRMASENGFKLSPRNLNPHDSHFDVYLAATNGVISVDCLPRVDFQMGNGIGDRVTSFSGRAECLNQTLRGLQFQPISNYTGPASLTLITNHPLI